MKLLAWLAPVAVLALVSFEAAPAEEVKKSSAPAAWDLKAFNALFRVGKAEHNERLNRMTWPLQTREGMRTFEFVRSVDREKPFTFFFYDEGMAELARVSLRGADFKGVPKTKAMTAGTRLEVTIDLPKAMPRVKKVVLKRGAPD